MGKAQMLPAGTPCRLGRLRSRLDHNGRAKLQVFLASLSAVSGSVFLKVGGLGLTVDHILVTIYGQLAGCRWMVVPVHLSECHFGPETLRVLVLFLLQRRSGHAVFGTVQPGP
jgi:hypothetical protein